MKSEITKFKDHHSLVTHPAFQEGYIAGLDDPGFVTSKQPEHVTNPHPANSPEAEAYEAGYRAAIH